MCRLLWLSASILLLLLGLGPSLQAPSKNLRKADCKCPSEKNICNCALAGITSVPSGILKNCSKWKKIDLSFNRIDTLNPPGRFSGFNCDNVERLSIFYNIINGTLQTGTFEGLPNLQYLNLSRNLIVTLKGAPFASCPKLRVVDLSLNKIRVIAKTTFDGAKSIESLNLFGNFIGFIDGGAFALQKLLRLDLAQNNITQLQERMFDGLQNLEELDLMRNPVKEIETGVFSRTPNLLRLKLGLCGKLGELGEIKAGTFSGLVKLTDFNLTSCHVQTLEMEAFKGLSSLQRLSLRRNRLMRFDRRVWEPLKSLRTLDLSENQLACMVGHSFDSLASLQVLNLASNRLTFLSDDVFRGLEKLESLILDDNPFRFVQIDAFCSLSSLISLSLKNVYIGHIITTDDKNSSIKEAVAALPKSIEVVLSNDDNSLRGIGSGCRSATKSTPSTGNATCPVYLDFNTFPAKPNSRQYLLIIIGVCVSFLLTAMAVILCYRAWSKRKRTACEKAEQAALEEEKQEMMEKPSGTNAHANGGNTTTELLAAGQSAENGVVLHHPGAAKPGQPEAAPKDEESTMTHLAVV